MSSFPSLVFAFSSVSFDTAAHVVLHSSSSQFLQHSEEEQQLVTFCFDIPVAATVTPMAKMAKANVKI